MVDPLAPLHEDKRELLILSDVLVGCVSNFIWHFSNLQKIKTKMCDYLYHGEFTSQCNTHYEIMHKTILDKLITVNYGIKQTHAMHQLYQNRHDSTVIQPSPSSCKAFHGRNWCTCTHPESQEDGWGRPKPYGLYKHPGVSETLWCCLHQTLGCTLLKMLCGPCSA